MDAMLKAPSWNPLSCHMKGWTHTTHGYGQKQLPAISSNSLQTDPTEFWLNSPFLGKPQSHNALGAHPITLQENENKSDTSLSSPHIIAVKFYGLIRHFHLQWESRHRQEICQVVRNFISQQLENPGSPALSSDGTIPVPVDIVYLTPVQNRAK